MEKKENREKQEEKGFYTKKIEEIENELKEKSDNIDSLQGKAKERAQEEVSVLKENLENVKKEAKELELKEEEQEGEVSAREFQEGEKHEEEQKEGIYEEEPSSETGDDLEREYGKKVVEKWMDTREITPTINPELRKKLSGVLENEQVESSARLAKEYLEEKNYNVENKNEEELLSLVYGDESFKERLKSNKHAARLGMLKEAIERSRGKMTYNERLLAFNEIAEGDFQGMPEEKKDVLKELYEAVTGERLEEEAQRNVKTAEDEVFNMMGVEVTDEELLQAEKENRGRVVHGKKKGREVDGERWEDLSSEEKREVLKDDKIEEIKGKISGAAGSEPSHAELIWLSRKGVDFEDIENIRMEKRKKGEGFISKIPFLGKKERVLVVEGSDGKEREINLEEPSEQGRKEIEEHNRNVKEEGAGVSMNKEGELEMVKSYLSKLSEEEKKRDIEKEVEREKENILEKYCNDQEEFVELAYENVKKKLASVEEITGGDSKERVIKRERDPLHEGGKSLNFETSMEEFAQLCKDPRFKEGMKEIIEAMKKRGMDTEEIKELVKEDEEKKGEKKAETEKEKKPEEKKGTPESKGFLEGKAKESLTFFVFIALAALMMIAAAMEGKGKKK